ncbi:hypothetical protein P691DRAFT_763850, partial [Macrolepiota fuliginosa MF-IS2]
MTLDSERRLVFSHPNAVGERRLIDQDLSEMHVRVNTVDFLEKLLPLPRDLDLSLLINKLKDNGLYKDDEWVGLNVDDGSSKSGKTSRDGSSKTEKALKGDSSSRSGGILQDGGSFETGGTSQDSFSLGTSGTSQAGGSLETGETSQGGSSLKGRKAFRDGGSSKGRKTSKRGGPLKGRKTSKRGGPSKDVGTSESRAKKPRGLESKMYGPLANILTAINKHACAMDQKSADRLCGEWIDTSSTSPESDNPNSKCRKPDFIFTSTTNARALEDGLVSPPEDIDDEPQMRGDTMES